MKIQATTNHLRMLSSVRGELWAMNEDRVRETAFACLDAIEKTETHADLSDLFPMKQEASMIQTDSDKIAVIGIRGSLMNKAPKLYEELGLVTRYSTIEAETNAAVNEGATGIIYAIDSPGGTVAGVIETADAIGNAGVPTVAWCDGLACSAAYWLASQTDAIVSTPSAEVGNIGAILSWADCSKFWDSMGVEWKALVSEGADLKSTFHTEPDDSQIAFLQERINSAGEAFRNAVEEGRAKSGESLDPEVWRAGWYSGDKAQSLGLVDAIGKIDVALKFFC